MVRSPISRYLTAANLSGLEFARRLGVRDSTVYRWMTGKRRPSLRMALRIESITGGAVTAKSLDRPLA